MYTTLETNTGSVSVESLGVGVTFQYAGVIYMVVGQPQGSRHYIRLSDGVFCLFNSTMVQKVKLKSNGPTDPLVFILDK